MGLSREQQDAILAADNARRADRALADFANLTGVTRDQDYLISRGITGEPSEANRTHRASRDFWTHRRRVFGVAPGTEGSAREATVAVTRDGVTRVQPVSDFARPSQGRRVYQDGACVGTYRVIEQASPASAASAPEAARLGGSQADVD